MENKKSVFKYMKWYTPEKEKQYPDSFKIDLVGQPYKGACYYRITRCPICLYCEHTIAQGGSYCDYYITGNQEAPRA